MGDTAQHRTGQDRTGQDRTGQDSTGQARIALDLLTRGRQGEGEWKPVKGI